jgi:L-threonylcarbamoyladenylate synthase
MARPTPTDVTAAAEVLKRGGLVAFPTETVYGLGADARSSEAVRKIFAAKGRPSEHPLIVHAASEEVARRYAAHWPDAAHALAEQFWPGPLTLVVRKLPIIAGEATAGRDTVGLRVPNHPIALELLRAFDGPVAAPSANRWSRVSPTTADHVRAELGDRVDCVLDGGPCAVGIESTVLDLTVSPAALLRPGGVSRELIERIIGPVEMREGLVHTSGAAASPGLHEAHYRPATATFRFEAKDAGVLGEYCRRNAGRKMVLLALPGAAIAALGDLPAGCKVVVMPAEATDYARRLYSALREADEMGAEAIWVEMPPEEPAWAAVRDRLRRATRPAAEKV